MRKKVWFFAAAAFGTLLTGCGACANAGLCKFAPDEETVAADYEGTLILHPGETRRVKLELTRYGGSTSPIPEGQTFRFDTSQPSARALGQNTLYLWADNQVKVTWDGVPFTKDNAYVTVSATAAARQPQPNDPNNGSTGVTMNYAYIQATDAQTSRVGSLRMFINIAE